MWVPEGLTTGLIAKTGRQAIVRPHWENVSVSDGQIAKVDHIEIAIEPWSWDFATARRNEIDRYFARLQQERSALWNGRALLLNRYSIGGGVLRGTCFETDYASFLAWCDWGFPEQCAFNFFAAAALCSADGAYLLGEMAPYTACARQLYLPSGTPEPNDILVDGTLDLQANLRRELLEETGIDVDELDAEPGWTVVLDGVVVAIVKKLMAHQDASELRARIFQYLATEVQPELSDIRPVWGLSDLDDRMPRFMHAFFGDLWRS
jgi:8-oxo-dGTP pyrophosphatase MutT (NUDIX family)